MHTANRRKFGQDGALHHKHSVSELTPFESTAAMRGLTTPILRGRVQGRKPTKFGADSGRLSPRNLGNLAKTFGAVFCSVSPRNLPKIRGAIRGAIWGAILAPKIGPTPCATVGPAAWGQCSGLQGALPEGP